MENLLIEVYSRDVCDLFTKGRHHRNISVILITKNLFHQGRFSRDISLNAKYLVVFVLNSPETFILKKATDCMRLFSTLREGRTVTCCTISHRIRMIVFHFETLYSPQKWQWSILQQAMKRIDRIIASYKPSSPLRPQLRKAIIENSDTNLVLGISKLTLNILNGNCKISWSDVDHLRKNKTVLRRLVHKGIALCKKRKLIVQRGGFQLLLLTEALSALPSLIRL